MGPGTPKGCCMLNTTLIFIDCRQLWSTNVFCPLYRNQSHGWDPRLCLKALARKSAPKPRQRNSCMWVQLSSGSSILTSIPPLLGIRQSITHEREDFLPCYLIQCQGNSFMKFQGESQYICSPVGTCTRLSSFDWELLLRLYQCLQIEFILHLSNY